MNEEEIEIIDVSSDGESIDESVETVPEVDITPYLEQIIGLLEEDTSGSTTEEVVPEDIWTKSFDTYSVSESLLLLIFIIFLIRTVSDFIGGKIWLRY